MTSLLLATKLYIPQPRTNAVLRPRLIAQLNSNLDRKLTLISAPAGFGKTTLASEWVAGCGRPVAWVSLDDADSDPIRFLRYLAAALQGAELDMTEDLLAALDSSQPPPIQTLLTSLLNAIASSPEPFILVLDDYHVIDSPPVDQALTFFLDHLPPQMHLVITTRDDPQLPISRLRARGQLAELRAAQLRFTAAEAADFLNRVMGLNLSASHLATLDDRTEGWIAGLQLAALSLQGREDADEFLNAFAGDHRYIVDYLVEEVLRLQPEHVRRFMLQTAILDRMSGPLCDAVTGQGGGAARLEALERGNLFVVPLDDSRHWFRYHHLFADVLYAHLMAEHPDQIAALHGRASKWYEEHGSTGDAIRHALTAQDFMRAADLIERTIPVMTRDRQETMLLDWLRTLPDDILRDRPVLSVYFAGTLLLNGQTESVEAKLKLAERWINRDVRADAARDRPIFVDEAEFQSVPASIAMYRAAMALALGDTEQTIQHARKVLEIAFEDDHLRRASAAGLIGLACWTRGELEAAGRAYIDSIAGLQRAGHISDTAGLAIGLAGTQMAMGRLRDAMQTYERTLQRVTLHNGAVLRGAGDMHVGLSEIYLERNDLASAIQHVLRSQALGHFAGLPQNPYRQCVAMARIREAQGDLDAALDLLDEAEQVYASDLFPRVRPIPALRARVWVAQGRLSEAINWARDHQLSTDDDLSYLREFDHISFARILIAKQKANPADESSAGVPTFLMRLKQAAEQGGRTGSLIEILVLQTLASHAYGDIAVALASLEHALRLAESEGYVRMFVSEGQSMETLLKKAAKSGIAPAYTRSLLNAFDSAGAPPVKQALIEPLSERELEVLRLLHTDLDGPDLARTLTVSLNTIRTHTKNIYSKLGVNSRRAAVRRAEELGLL